MPKIYAVKFSDGTRWLGDNWPDCEKQVRGKTGVKYRAFPSIEDAKTWFEGGRAPRKGLYVYVDGSFMPHSEYAGWSWVAVEDDVEIAVDSGKTPFQAASRNIDGELYAAWKAMEFLAKKKRKGVICHDYQGVASWALGEWKANSVVAQVYINKISEVKKWATFEKVTGHSGDKWNDKADMLAKAALTKEKPKKGKKKSP
ncbi:MAG: ribonuclease H family protein [Fibromonadaceae bacterium]|jgi:ribonuclease HI|nr:ribonuclease H family protein [Fibromonadaceae bacterium]